MSHIHFKMDTYMPEVDLGGAAEPKNCNALNVFEHLPFAPKDSGKKSPAVRRHFVGNP